MMGLLGPPCCWAVIILTSFLTERSISACLAAISSSVAQSTYFPWLRSCRTWHRHRPRKCSPLEPQEGISNNHLFSWQKQLENKTHEIARYGAGTIRANT